MSDTPRTDAALSFRHFSPGVDKDFARTLERELAQAHALVRDCLDLARERGAPDCAWVDPAGRYAVLRERALALGIRP